MYIMCYHIHEYILNWPRDQNMMFSWIYIELYVCMWIAVYVFGYTHGHTHWHICILYIFLFMWPAVAISHRCIPTGSENNSHQAISNLPFLSKIVEKAVYQQLNNYFQSLDVPTFSSIEQWKNWSNGLWCKGWTIKSQCTAVMLESTQERNLGVVRLRLEFLKPH